MKDNNEHELRDPQDGTDESHKEEGATDLRVIGILIITIMSVIVAVFSSNFATQSPIETFETQGAAILFDGEVHPFECEPQDFCNNAILFAVEFFSMAINIGLFNK